MARRIIGLTGGIATGKSSVAAYLESQYKLPILDADIYARDAVKPGSVALASIAQRYGAEILLADGNLDRKQLGNIVFNDESERTWLEGQIHPYVREQILAAQRQLTDPIVVAVVPLLFEAKMTDLATEIWVVVCTDEQQCQRLMRRDSISRSQAKTRIASQMPVIEKAHRATVVIDNNSDLTRLYNQVDQAMNVASTPQT
ncbi:dephospho-CoA kinase [Acaryochloris marina]|uniref:Dephospho-CoA kinase n=1 Tax=Acaryochloris marina (strain MBIC 11017) TaxID=329726 RepID=B0C989_ACAM1|nr:dephospho-CoA kinase [Acaryochloris marina]ABW27770.1 dephospho-CoA kinase [Acaryochloris marina MBIC11017]BDM82499.1 dephospho-CoA kinase [Acaryochloris marina MBIC10699]